MLKRKKRKPIVRTPEEQEKHDKEMAAALAAHIKYVDSLIEKYGDDWDEHWICGG